MSSAPMVEQRNVVMHTYEVYNIALLTFFDEGHDLVSLLRIVQSKVLCEDTAKISTAWVC
jgi:hypothetical protein